MATAAPRALENHPVVSHDAWIAARKALLAKEKEFTRLRDELSRERRALPWEKVDKEYAFDGPSGRETLVTISRAALTKLERFKRRMGSGFRWVSSAPGDFNYDYHVSFTPEEIESGSVVYNYASTNTPVPDREGVSVFYRDPRGAVYHTYSCDARGHRHPEHRVQLPRPRARGTG